MATPGVVLAMLSGSGKWTGSEGAGMSTAMRRETSLCWQMSSVSCLATPGVEVATPRLLLSLHGVAVLRSAEAGRGGVAVCKKIGRASTELVVGSSTNGIEARALRVHA